MRIANLQFLAWTDLRQKLREKETLLWVFLMPVLFFFFFGEATSSFAGSDGPKGTALTVEIPEAEDPLVQRVLLRLSKEDFRVVQYVKKADSVPRRLLRIPADLSGRVQRKERVQFRFEQRATGAQSAFDEFRLQKALYSTLADFVLLNNDGLPISDASFAKLDEQPRQLTIDAAPAGKRRVVPSGYQQAVPGMMVMFTLMMMMTACSILLVTERTQGLFRRLAAAPITRGELVAAKWLAFVALALVQTIYAMLVGAWLFGMEWGPNYGSVFVVLMAWAMFCASAGLLFGCLVRTASQAQGLGVLVVLVLAALGGCWWPIEIVPTFMQDLAGMLPTGWAMGALHGIVSYGGTLPSVLLPVCLMLGGALLLGVLGARSFGYE